VASDAKNCNDVLMHQVWLGSEEHGYFHFVSINAYQSGCCVLMIVEMYEWPC